MITKEQVEEARNIIRKIDHLKYDKEILKDLDVNRFEFKLCSSDSTPTSLCLVGISLAGFDFEFIRKSRLEYIDKEIS